MPRKKHQVGFCMKPCKTVLGEVLRAQRLKLRLSQEEVAINVGWSQKEQSQLELGNKLYIDTIKAEKFAKILKLDANMLKVLGRDPKEKLPTSEFGKFIRKRREELRLSKRELARRLGKSVSYVTDHEVGHRKFPLRLWSRWATALECGPSQLRPYLYLARQRKESDTALGKFLRSKREAVGLSLGQVSEKVGFSRQHLSKVEIGTWNANKNLLGKLAGLLEFELSELDSINPQENQVNHP